MKKIISMLLTVSMLLSVLPLSAFAENEILDTEVVTETQEETFDESKIGSEVEIGNDLYSIQEDGLYVSKDFGRDTLLSSGEITWVIERDGALYWSKIEGYNADIYRFNLENGNETILARVFAPATAFDVDGDFVYYLYNGEISKANVLTGEEVSMGMFDCDGFYIMNDGSISLIKLNKNDMWKEPKEVHLTSANEITERITSMRSILEGKYWNAGLSQTQLEKNVEYFIYGKHSEQTYMSKLGLTNDGCPSSSKYSTPPCTSNQFGGSTQCRGFAKFVFFALFGKHIEDSVYLKGNAIGSNTLEPGDYIADDGHAAIVWKVSGDSFSTIECFGTKRSYRPGCKIMYSSGFNGTAYTSISSMLSHLKSSNGILVKNCGKPTKPIPPNNDESTVIYDVEKAMNYASKHYDDNDRKLCAEFVSDCLRAGGLNIPVKTTTLDCYDTVLKKTGLSGNDLILDTQGYALESNNSQMLSRGDVVIQWCYTHNKRPHILICSGYDSKGRAKFYGHNGPTNDEAFKVGRSNAYEHSSSCNMGAKSIHFVFCDNCRKAGTKDFKYEGYGVCKHKKEDGKMCNTKYDYEATRTTATNKDNGIIEGPGTYVQNGTNKYGKLTLWNEPYTIGKKKTKKFDTIEIMSMVINADGGKWYQVKADGETGYMVKYKVDSDYKLKESSAPSITLNKSGEELKFSVSGNTQSFYDPVKLKQGQSCGLRGKIHSAAPILKVEATVYRADTNAPTSLSYTQTVKNGVCNLQNEINNRLSFNRLSAGNYYLKYTIKAYRNETDKNPVTKTETSGVITIGNVGTAPNIAEKSVKIGKEIEISCGDKNATIKYKVDGGKEKTIAAGQKGVYNLTTKGNHEIIAWSVVNGVESSKTVRMISVPSSKPTTILEMLGTGKATILDTDIDVDYGDKSAYAIISGEGEIYYTTDGSTPTENSSKYIEPIPLKNSCAIKAISIEYGCAPSDVVTKDIVLSEPESPVIALKDTKQKIAQGKTATVSWSPVQYATSYYAYLYYNGVCVQEIKDINGTTASFKLTEAGDYTIKVKAKNFKGFGSDSNGVVVSSMAPVTVTFVDRVDINVQDNIDRYVAEEKAKGNIIERQIVEGNVLLKQKVDYDTVPVRPAVASKKGYTFTGWSKDAYNPVTKDTTVYAEFEINYYTVEFWNYWNEDEKSIIGNPQEIMYSGKAIPPNEYHIPDDNYVFAGWSVDNKLSEGFDYNFVDGNMKINTAFTWKNMDLPASVEIISVRRTDNCQGYTVQLKLVNNDLKDTEARVIVGLYTKDNRMVHTQTIEMVMEEFPAGKSDSRKIDLAYSHKISKVKAVMVRVTDDKTGGAVSKMVESSNIVFPDDTGYYGVWSSWSDNKAGTKDKRQFDERKVYSYRDKQTKTSSSKTLDGWNLYNTTSSTGSWSGWSQTKVTASTTDSLKREVETRYIQPTYKTQYNYYGYMRTNPNTKYHFCPNYYSNSYYIESGWRDTTIPFTSWYNHSGGSYSRQSCVHGDETTGFYREGSGKPYYYWSTSRQVQTGGGYTEYRYRDTTYTYHFWKWGNWSTWSDTVYKETTDREVKHKPQYRYRDYVSNFEGYDPTKDDQTEEKTEETFPFAGNLEGIASDYIKESEITSGNYNVISGPYYKDDEGNYKLIADNKTTVEKHRYSHYTNGNYGMPCKECAEENYGGEWELKKTDWVDGVATITKDAYSCDNENHSHLYYSRFEDGVYYWDLYEVDGKAYYFMETNVIDVEVTYTDKNKYYLVDRDFNGKRATVLVYKKTNSDPTQEQLQYVDQIIIGENNSYSFKVNPKEKIDYYETGDFIVTLSIEGCKLLNNIDIIKAEVPTYKVEFLDDNGVPISYVDEKGQKQEHFIVNEGGYVDVTLIEAPEKEGYRFVKWDKSVVNIQKNTIINAIYEPKEYAVVFVDHENETTQLEMLPYGTPVIAPDVRPVEGKIFKGWDNLPDDGNVIVTGSQIITAMWDDVIYTVKFCDLDGNIIEKETQDVPHGEAAELPAPIVSGGVVYPWSTSGETWWNVTKDMIIYPYVQVESALSAPVADVATGSYDEYLLVNLEADENSKIYYSTCIEITEEDAERYAILQQQENKGDVVSLMSTEVVLNDEVTTEGEVSGSESMDADTMLKEMITEFTEPIPITYSTVIYAFTVDEDGNISTISSFEYNINEYEPEEEKFVPADDVEQITMPSIVVKPGETVEVPLTLKNNPGIKNLSLILGYDAENLELISTTNGEVFRNTEFSKDTREDGSCKLEWVSLSENTNNGILATLTFKAKDNAGEFDIGFNEITSSDGEEEEYFAVVNGTVANVGKNALIGDTNNDGEINYQDAILLIRYDVGLTTLFDYQKSISDVNNDGDVDFADAIKILRFDAGLINSLK